MVLVGFFSTHLTYLLLVIIYIFGYGTYALNCKKDKCLEIKTSKKIILNYTNNSDKTFSTCTFKWSKKDTYKRQSAKIDFSSDQNYNLLKNIKSQEHFLEFPLKSFLFLRISSRPPPHFA